MTDREQDVAIAKAMGLKLDPGSKIFRWYDLPHYDTPEGSWKILDYVRENPGTVFRDYFIRHLDDLLGCDGFTLTDVVIHLTPTLICDAAHEAAKECLK